MSEKHELKNCLLRYVPELPIFSAIEFVFSEKLVLLGQVVAKGQIMLIMYDYINYFGTFIIVHWVFLCPIFPIY